MACEDNVMFGIIEEATSDEFPDGNAKLAWTNLYKKFEPNTGGRKVRLKSEFQKQDLQMSEMIPTIGLDNQS